MSEPHRSEGPRRRDRTRDNEAVAARFREAADLLEAQGANPFRIAAYRRGAQTVEAHPESLRDVVDGDGAGALTELEGIGAGLASAIREMLATGRWSQLERLRGEAPPEAAFRSVPGIGPVLAKRIHERLHVDTLEALEAAAEDGRLADVPGIGPRRAAAVRASLSQMLDRRLRPPAPSHRPAVETLLSVDAEYREKASAGELPRLAPRRFNPEGRAWLPILHTDRDGWHFTALFSNTARAHRLGRTRDWVVLYYYDDHHRESQSTVVTETTGVDSGRRVVRGRESECSAYYSGLARGRDTSEGRERASREVVASSSAAAS